MCGRARCITTAPFDGHHPTDKIQRISGPPGDAYIRRQHRRQSQRRIRGQELAPSLPQPPTGGTYGIQPVAGSPTTPSGCRHAHARAGWWCWVWCKGARYKPGRRRHTKAGRPTRPSRGRTGFTPATPGGCKKLKKVRCGAIYTRIPERCAHPPPLLLLLLLLLLLHVWEGGAGFGVVL